MALMNKILFLPFAGLVIFVGIDPVHAQWTGGPVLIGGDDTDDHFDVGQGQPGGAGRPYMREGFNFLGAHVTNGKKLAVCNRM